MKHFILMSDIIASSTKNQAQTMLDFKNCTHYINQKYACELSSPLTITLGDEFQAVIKNLGSAINILIELEEFIIEHAYDFKLRHVVYYGEIETPINPTIAYEMLGEGLTNARKRITIMKGSNTRFSIFTGDTPKDLIINNSFHIYQHIIDNWNLVRDHQLIHLLLKHSDYKIVAEMLNKERSLIWKREKSLNLSSYNAVKEILTTISS